MTFLKCDIRDGQTTSQSSRKSDDRPVLQISIKLSNSDKNQTTRSDVSFLQCRIEIVTESFWTIFDLTDNLIFHCIIWSDTCNYIRVD